MGRSIRSEITVVAMPGNEHLAAAIGSALGARRGAIAVGRFPDGEALVRVMGEHPSGDAIVVCSLEHPDDKILPLIFAADALRDLGATRVGLVAPYLGYMRQDRRFHDGEAISAISFASLLSRAVDWMVTVEPHLHRIHSLGQIYSIPTEVVHVARELAGWVSQHVPNAVLVGPDAESRQWVRDVAQAAGMPYVVLRKQRLSSEHVEVSLPDVGQYRGRTPVLVDDVISTGHTISEAARQLVGAGFRAPVCVAVHAVFAPGCYAALRQPGIESVVTTTTIAHESNAIDVAAPIVDSVRRMLVRVPD
jgi:ribose-phosphate pyrophosphokinase